MKKLLLLLTLISAGLLPGFAQQRANAVRTKGLALAFFDEERLRSPDGQAVLENFAFFLKPIADIAHRDFPDIEFKIVRRGELVRLPDGTGINVQNMQPPLGYVFAVPGKKHYVLSGIQSDEDFACAAATYFRRKSPACSRTAAVNDSSHKR